ncbi:sn-glycerol-3-phosphate ABC transporter ATP-binding protein UgpC [Nitratireductor aquimarinus]|uniref:ABC transporter ATP-binding protein n=1 Tax=Nitratireductor aquimarinus TaxID=889300 RepID=UPI001A8DBF9A|nr:sn-glycerol-3-phosphate ABC transporter ATP-binding protein UgpC [Nitratireductor aquimarinus]MBN8245744.1 sn-glycerol-3-phosphate ABC transporter ATP-binding protein UgpC [Nitratireductor aquimarinus]MBY6134126.1 sn-glycerol-3-phosphate ABC transporter ATP-binding protein UgpC [Nitratireductor aquimarinus]MCA1305220.1 sn-glycerol-3-phosphate ABC transporter ATP-binding protein UgpC [Nitratireductor aquimarinus]
MTSVVLDRVVKKWGRFVGVNDVSLEIADGEFLVLLGPSGCGKSTTMRMVAGLEEPTSGEIRIGDRVVNDLAPGERDLAMVFQNYGLYPHMTIAQNIGYPLKVAGVPRQERMKRVQAAADRVELSEYLERRPHALSGGQRQRVALGRAIVRTPQLFLMDEPLSNLDAKLRVSMRAQIKHLQKELNTTTIYVTHDQVEAMTLADRVAVMAKGEIQQIGAPLDIYNRPANAFVASFLGSPSMNLFEMQVSDGELRNPSFRLRAPDNAPSALTIGQRPEDMAAVAPGEGDFDSEVYTAELLGDTALITVRIGHDLVSIKAPKDTGFRMGDRVGIRFDRDTLHYFDGVTGTRIEFETGGYAA